MRLRRRRLSTTDRLNVQVALTVQIDRRIAMVKGAASVDEIEMWARDAASQITTLHRVTAPARGELGSADQCERWASTLAAAVLEAAARTGQP